jgi:uroporphyrin-III C-methyltransferase / precorrin-2 dehydrogenase / sirohydrochlorin ferrochelatase
VNAPPSTPIRRPTSVPARIAPLPSLPLFHKLAGRRVVVAGGSEAALWKAELASAAGAKVRVLAGAQAQRFEALAAAPVSGPVRVLSRPWRKRDLDGAALAFADLEGEEGASFAAAARAARVPVNLIDRPELSEFQVGSIVNRAPIVLAISTDGAAPMLGQSIRARIEAMLPLGLSAWAKAAREWRLLLKARLGDFPARRAFWRRFTETAWTEAGRAPESGDFAALLAGLPDGRSGSVALVGAGPGDPELLTLKAVRALQAASVILYDDLVGARVLDLARREAKRIAVGKTGRGPSCSQAEINARMVALALAGETVIRLKGGDPTIFGRASEELRACRAAGVPVTIVPGISAAQGAAASLGLSLTERRRARRIQFVTGHGADGRLPADIDWGALADRKATTILYMPRGTLAEFVRKALAKGMDPATPAVAVASATLPGQAHVAATIGGIESLVPLLPPGAPVTILIGWAMREIPGLRCEASPAIPLFGTAS